MVPQNSLAAMHLQTMSNAGPSVTKHIKLNMCNPIFAESICNGILGVQSGICLQLLRRHKTVCTWVLLKSEDSTQEILAAPATNPRVYLLNIYFATCDKTNSLQIGRCWRRLRTNKLCISSRTGLNILLSAAVNLVFFWGFFWVDALSFATGYMQFLLPKLFITIFGLG